MYFHFLSGFRKEEKDELISIRSITHRAREYNLPSVNLFGVDEAPSANSSAGLESGGVCTRDPVGFLADIGADIEGLREFDKLNGLPSSESLSPVEPVKEGYVI